MQPTLETNRLALRPFVLADAPRVQLLAGEFAIAEVTAHIPHPYEDGMAEAWISTHSPDYAARREVTFAIVTKLDDALVGAICLMLAPEVRRGELGYWIGVPWWGRGYATEASRAMIEYGFTALHLHKIAALHFTRNPASGRVMQKVGMRHEGTLRGHVVKWGKPEDMETYGILVDETPR